MNHDDDINPKSMSDVDKNFHPEKEFKVMLISRK